MDRLPITRLVPLVAALAALLSGLLFISQGELDPDGVPALPLDDSYIHLQYAWQAAQGHFFQYNTGDAPTTGATSLLYMLLLALGFALGVGRAAMPGLTFGLGLLLFAGSAALLADLARRAAQAVETSEEFQTPPFPPWSAGLLAGLLYAGSGWMAWAFFSGMETGLLVALVVGVLWGLGTDRPLLTALLTSLAVLTRPEAAILALVVLLAVAWLRDPGVALRRRQRALAALVPLGVALVPPALSLLLTGSPAATGLQAKSWLTIVPFYPDRVLGIVAVTTLELLKTLGGPALDGRWHAFPLAQALALLGAGLLWQRGRAVERRLALVCVGWVLLGALATATLQTATWHHYRYQMPLYPALLLPLAVTLTGLGNEVAARWSGRRVWAARAALAAAVVLWTAHTLSDFWAAYRLDTRTTVAMQDVLADWLRRNTPEDARVAVHDVGVMRYLGGRYTLDVVGLTSPEMARIGRHGPGATYEALERQQPDYYAVYPDTAMPYYGLESAAVLFGRELFRITVDPWSPYTSAGDTQIVAQPDWSTAALAEAPQQPFTLERLAGWTPVDRLDVADLDDEAAHGYQWWHQGRPEGFLTLPLYLRYREDPAIALADGGRQLTGGESFTLRTPQPGEWLLLVARLHQAADMTLRVRVNGADAGLWRLPAVPGEWLESAFLVAPDLVRSAETRVTLTLEDAPPEARYSPFHYWAYQGEPPALPPPPATVTDVAFGEVARLRGFDLPRRLFAPGEALSLTLYWEAIDPPRADHRVFIHLMNPEDDSPAGIVAQADGQPRRGTYPFWVWRRRETVRETVRLEVPPATPPGEYLLLLGIYDGASGERLSFLGGDDYGASRLILARVTVR